LSALTGKRIVITRAPHQSPEFERLLRERGAVPLLYPCIDIAPPQLTEPLDNALYDAANGAFDWLLLTSGNTVQAIARRLNALDLSLSGIATLGVAAVGPATGEAARRLLGLHVDVIPDMYTAGQLAAALQPTPATSILLPQSALAGDTLSQTLRSAGATVTIVEAYQTVIGSGGVNLPALLAAGAVDAMTFTSPSTVKNLLVRLDVERGDAALLESICIACIGSTTAAAARECGFSVAVLPREHTLSGLTTALERYFDSVRSNERC
jgi:uroporphyrinogen-III synthase